VPTGANPDKRRRLRFDDPDDNSDRDEPLTPACPCVVPVRAKPVNDLPAPAPEEKRLLIFGTNAGSWKQWWSDLQRGPDGGRPTNQNLCPIVRPLSDKDLLFQHQELPGGHCWALYTRTRVNGWVRVALKLREGGFNNDAPRTQTLPGLPGRKIYNYHIIAAVEAHDNPSPHLNLDLLHAVSKDKRDDGALTVMHLCGHKWCHNPAHLAVGTKEYNDEQTGCHRGIQSKGSRTDVDLVRDIYCNHSVKCWSILYKGEFADAVSWA
jgi:hypothetical protein